MFLLLGFGYISLIKWYRRQHKLWLYVSAVDKACNRSIVVNRVQGPALSVQQLLRSHCWLSVDISAAENKTLSTLVEDEKIVLSAISPKMILHLSTWTRCGDCLGAECPCDMYVVLETSSPVSGELHIHDQEILKHSLAWKSESFTSVVVGCNLRNFISLCEKFADGTLALNENSDIERLLTVEVMWSLDRPFSSKEPSALSVRTFQSRKSMKPPNIMIYCGKIDSLRQFQSVHDTIKSCLKPDSYTLYHLQHDHVRCSPWQENSLLLILASEHVCEEVEDVFLNYLYSGGQVLSFGRTFETKFLQTRYVPYLSGLTSFSFLEKWENVKCFRGQYKYEEKKGVSHGSTVTVMAREKPNGEPVIVCIDQHPQKDQTMGKAIFSQLYLHKDPTESAEDQETFKQLKQNNPARIEILQYLLSCFAIDCCQSDETSLTAASLLTVSKDLKITFLSSLRNHLKEGCLKSQSVTLEFLEYEVDDLRISSSHLPVICVDALPHCYFRQQLYWQNLTTNILGHVVIYSDVLPTTMTLFERLQFLIPENIGLVAIAGRQTTGKGRCGNTWLSPEGGAMFSLLVQIPVDSKLGQRISFLQHITSLAVIYSVTTIAGYEMLDLKLKWPNDIYYSNKMKIGGVLVTSTVMGPTIHAVIGCGFNVTNSNPTICIGDVITQYNKQHGTELPACSKEQLMARTINQIELLIKEFQIYGHEQFCKRYYSVWLHSGTLVKLESEGGQNVTITGLDAYGFLEVQTQNGMTQSVQPDGNTFDMMHNLISIKNRVTEK